MAGKTKLEPGSSTRIIVKFGTVTKKVKGNKKTYTAFCWVTQRVADALGLQEAPRNEYVRKEGDKSIVMRGEKGSKSVRVDNPNKPGKFMSLPVPGNATIEQIGDFLKPTKAARFALQGRFYSCPGEEAEAAKTAKRSSAAAKKADK